MKVKIEEIKVNPGRRAVSQDGIEELAFSIEQIGLLHPITLTEDHTLVAGLHRLEAVKSLGWSEIECTITDLDGLTAQLAELDENFARTNLSPLEIGDFLKRRKEIYEELYPETKAGVAQAIGRNKARGKPMDCYGLQFAIEKEALHFASSRVETSDIWSRCSTRLSGRSRRWAIWLRAACWKASEFGTRTGVLRKTGQATISIRMEWRLYSPQPPARVLFLR